MLSGVAFIYLGGRTDDTVLIVIGAVLCVVSILNFCITLIKKLSEM